MTHFVFYFRALIAKYPVYLRGPALSPWQWLIPGEPKGHFVTQTCTTAVLSSRK